ncbi:MAG TPA: prolyl oligopeptidase family serine peptidase [Capsulimonadaceae bacterium]|nr:prolyl oligopeptidase family serine peptidase [Capsulimonadaceae bacterium]
MKRWTAGTAAAGLAAIAACCAAAGLYNPPPVARIAPVMDTYFGHKVVDPYRWMETPDSSELKGWMKGQADYARLVIDAIPGRKALLAQIVKLDNAGTSVESVQIGGSRYFYLKVKPGFESPKLFVRDGLHSPERLLVDPEKMGKAGSHYAIDYFTPSWDGKYVAYGASPGGSENSVIHVLNVDAGKELSETIDRARFGGIAWRMDNRSFFYNRLPKLLPGAPPAAEEEKSVVFLHKLGGNPDTDPPVFGYGLSATTHIAPADTPYVQVVPGSPFAYGVIEHGVQNELTLYAVRTTALDGASTKWRKIVDVQDDVTAFDAHGSDLFLLSHKNASRFKVLRLDLDRSGDHPAVFVPASSVVIKGIGVARDALYLQDLDGGIGRIRRVGFGGGTPRRLALPYDGAVPFIVTYTNQPGLIFLESAWTHSALWYSYNPVTGHIADTKLKPLSPVSFAGITSMEVKAKSADGTLVPLSIIYKKGIKLDGSHPTLLEGYGAYGITIDPYFNPTALPWLSRGGVLAFSHVRGGGEYGEDWHRAGMKLTKQHSIDDFIACARYLIAKGYTSPAHLAGTGASAGGIVVGGALTQHPDLFGAMIDEVGVSDALRSELEPNGPPNIPEFGSFTTPDGFEALYAMDAYLHVRNGVRYPAVLLTTGINDPRVASWEPAKMAARLQAATASDKPILLRVDYDAGHGIGSTKAQDDALQADEDAFLFWQLGAPGYQPGPSRQLAHSVSGGG